MYLNFAKFIPHSYSRDFLDARNEALRNEDDECSYILTRMILYSSREMERAAHV